MTAPAPSPHRRGFSLAELMVSIAMVGCIAAIAIPIYGRCLESSRAAIAANVRETVNSAIHRYNQYTSELAYPAADANTADEFAVLRTLQFRAPNNPAPGSPYVRNDWNPASSGSNNDYRLVWSGTLFRLVTPGQSGTGLKVVFDASDLGQPYVFPPDYTEAGK